MLLHLRARLPYFALALGLLATSCTRKEEAAPSGAITGTMAPVAGVGQLLKVTAIAADKTEYTATLDPQTGAFSFPSLPPGRYTVKFSTTAAPDFPYWVTTEVVAGATATPPIPPITHDKVGRGTFKWTMSGKTYSATGFIKVYGEGDYFTVWGRSGSFDTAGEVRDVQLILPQRNEQGKLFAGVGPYLLGGTGRVMPTGQLYYYGSQPYFFVEYWTPVYPPPAAGPSSGIMQLTRYDAQQGVATGTFEFEGNASTGSGVPGAPAKVTVTSGEFNITF